MKINDMLALFRVKLHLVWCHLHEHFKHHRNKWVLSILILFLLGAILWPSVVLTIHAGEAGVYFRRFRGGTVVDRVYGEGIHMVAPWDKMTVYNVRFQTSPHEMDALTNTGMQIHIKLAVRYQPEYDTLGVLHKKVGPDYFKSIIIPDVEATIRTVVGKYNVEDLYSSQRDILQKLTNEAFSSAGNKYLKVDTVLLTQIEMPPKIKNAIEKKQEEQQLAEAYTYKLIREVKEAERRRIEAEGVSAANSIVSTSLSENILRWKGIEATLDVAKSPNSKIVLFGSGKSGLPLLFDTQTALPSEKRK
jgi:regulator of protease activity HflC (stomatin/prohibitin superfamily)